MRKSTRNGWWERRAGRRALAAALIAAVAALAAACGSSTDSSSTSSSTSKPSGGVTTSGVAEAKKMVSEFTAVPKWEGPTEPINGHLAAEGQARRLPG